VTNSVSLDELASRPSFGAGRRPLVVTFLPEPEPRPRRYTVISVDDHLVEPPHLFEGRVPRRFADRAPRVIAQDDGREVWLYDGTVMPNVGMNAVSGRPVSEYGMEPVRFDEMRRGCWDIHARIADMDLNGVYASLNFPSMLPGFAGQKFSLGADAELGLAVLRAWNDWHLEEWAGTNPDRIIPCQIPWLRDIELGAAEIRANARRGFKAVSFPEAPEKLGLPTLHSGAWDPFLEACAETSTVVCLHVGSASSITTTAPDAPADTTSVLFFVNSILAATDWLYSKVAVRFPDLRIALSEGGIGWVPALIDRIEHCFRYQEFTGGWAGVDIGPVDVLRRNFWFCTIDDPAGFELRHRVGVDRIMVESDYPHADSTWPDTQIELAAQLRDVPDDEADLMTWKNASELFRHPVPAHVLAAVER
jgi:predicted TIM-barrel fold metal-dependent hydrolase